MRHYFIPILTFLVIVGGLGYIFIFKHPERSGNPVAEGPKRSMPSFRIQALIEDSSGNMGIMSDAILRATNKPYVVNFFASWCQPCLAEHPFLMELSDDNSLQLFGIAWRDESEDTRAWITEYGNPFSFIGIDLDGRAGLEWGIAGVPETFFLDANGVIRFVHTGPLTPEIIAEGLLTIGIEQKSYSR